MHYSTIAIFGFYNSNIHRFMSSTQACFIAEPVYKIGYRRQPRFIACIIQR